MLLEPSEGAVALYLIEGIRNGWREAVGIAGLSHREEARAQQLGVQAYWRWWQQVRHLPPRWAAAVDPLRGTGLSWHP